MIIYVNSRNEIKDVNITSDNSLIPYEIGDNNPFEEWSKAKICCYKATVENGQVTMITPYVDSRLIDHIDQLGQTIDNNVTEIQTTNDLLADIYLEMCENSLGL